jgi:small-conductance mechanosensitive channel
VPSVPNWIVLVLAVLAAVAAVEVVRRVLRSRLIGSRWRLAEPLVRRCTWPGFTSAAVTTAHLVYQPAEPIETVEHALDLLLIACVTWLVIQSAYAVTDVILERLVAIEGDGNRRARRFRTQITLVRRVAAAVIIVLALGAMLFTFPAVRALGAGLLASAGIIGVVAGIAAQPTLGNMIAGLQLAFSDAIRLDDVVVVQNEWGRIEELTLTYVVLRLWDERRLVLPVSYFTQNPFENWTRHGSRVIGHVFLRVDWSVPVEELRTELYHFLRGHPLWDQKDWTLQVTDLLPNGLVELRALMSAADSASAWDLKCDVREHLITHIREHHPKSLPRFRVEHWDDVEPGPSPRFRLDSLRSPSPASPGEGHRPDGQPTPSRGLAGDD